MCRGQTTIASILGSTIQVKTFNIFIHPTKNINYMSSVAMNPMPIISKTHNSVLKSKGILFTHVSLVGRGLPIINIIIIHYCSVRVFIFVLYIYEQQLA